MYGAKEVGPDNRLYGIVERLASAAAADAEGATSFPSVAERVRHRPQSEHAAVAATEGILQILSDEELEGVIAHELAHVKHRDILISSVAATLAAAIMMVSRFAMFFGGARATIARAEPDCAARDDDPGADGRDADSGGDFEVARVRRGCGRRGDRRQSRSGWSSALRKIEGRREPFRSTPTPPPPTCSSSSRFRLAGCSCLFSTHPPTEQRIQALLSLDRGHSGFNR